MLDPPPVAPELALLECVTVYTLQCITDGIVAECNNNYMPVGAVVAAAATVSVMTATTIPTA